MAGTRERRAGHSGGPATSPAAARGSVLIDLYSGRENPLVTLDAAATRELHAMLPEPVGDRSLVDAACLEYPAIRGIDCVNGGTRWTP